MEAVNQVRKTMIFPSDVARDIDDFRFENRFRTDADALRALVKLGLEASRAGSEKGDGASLEG